MCDADDVEMMSWYLLRVFKGDTPSLEQMRRLIQEELSKQLDGEIHLAKMYLTWYFAISLYIF